jgi:hypothetical protein
MSDGIQVAIGEREKARSCVSRKKVCTCESREASCLVKLEGTDYPKERQMQRVLLSAVVVLLFLSNLAQAEDASIKGVLAYKGMP